MGLVLYRLREDITVTVPTSPGKDMILSVRLQSSNRYGQAATADEVREVFARVSAMIHRLEGEKPS